MLTAFLVLAIVALTLLTVSVVCWALDQGFWCWLLIGNDAIKLSVRLLFGAIAALCEINSD